MQAITILMALSPITRWIYDASGRLIESNFQFGDGPVDRTVYSYDEAGRHVRTEQISHDGTQTISESCTYEAGRQKTKVHYLRVGRRVDGYGIEGSEHAYPAPGATTMTTTYDERDFPSRVVFQDANGNTVTQVVLTRDAGGKLLKEEMHLSEESLFPALLEKIPPEERAGMATLIKSICGGPFHCTTYTYDPQARMVERLQDMGTLGEIRSTYHYEDREEPIAETSENRSREAGLDENGAVQYTPDRVTLQHNRFEYNYDAQGNWTERVVSFRLEPNPDFQRSNVERRAITYYAR